jgi:hypothetical protein
MATDLRKFFAPLRNAPQEALEKAAKAQKYKNSTSGRADEIVKRAEERRSQDVNEGRFLWDTSSSSPDFQQVLESRRAMAKGLSDPEFNTLRGRAADDLNRGTQTNLRLLRNQQAMSGIRGGAAGAQALNLLSDAGRSRANLNSDLAAQDIALRRQGVNDLEGTISSDRAGRIGTMFGMAGLGATDRANAQQQVLGEDFLKYYRNNLANLPGAPGSPDAPKPTWWQNIMGADPIVKWSRGENPLDADPIYRAGTGKRWIDADPILGPATERWGF